VLADKFNLVSKITFQRLLNAGKMFAGYHVSKMVKKPFQWAYPISISVEPTTHCNLRCPECPSGLRSFSRPTGMLKKKFFKELIDELHTKVMYLTFYFQGEPYLHPDFLEMVQYASQKKLYTATSTNAHYLTDENAKATIQSGLDKLIISMDGATQASYSAYRIGGDLEKVMQGIKNIVRWKAQLKSRTPHIVLQGVVFKQNEQELNELKKIGKEMGVNEVAIKTAQLYDYKNGNERMPLNETLSRYKKNTLGNYEVKQNPHLESCWRMWSSCVITWDGKIVPCCFDKDAKHLLGSLEEKSFKTIWFSLKEDETEAYRKFRTLLLKSRKEIDICSNCTEGVHVWA
jgi:radical SAM protein with 4Fe4S-binding SPASM domain